MNEAQEQTDEDLAVLALEDKQVFGLIIERYEKKLASYIHRLTNVNKEETEDLLQDVFLKAYLNLNNFDTTLKFSSWLYRITHNVVISSFRKKKASPQEMIVDDEIINNIAHSMDIEEDLHRKYLKKYFADTLKEMDQKYRDVVILKYMEEKSYKEISNILKIPEGTVSIRLKRAKKILEKKIDI